MIDFKKECSVFIIGKSQNSDTVLKFKYERSQQIDDYTLTEEAKKNFEDMKSKKLQGVSELVGIFIARNEEQYNEMNR